MSLTAPSEKNYLKHVIEHQKSGMSLAAYCSLHNLDYKKLSAMNSKLVSPGSISPQSPAFVELRSKPALETAAQIAPSFITVQTNKGSAISIPCELGCEQLSAIFKALGATL